MGGSSRLFSAYITGPRRFFWSLANLHLCVILIATAYTRRISSMEYPASSYPAAPLEGLHQPLAEHSQYSSATDSFSSTYNSASLEYDPYNPYSVYPSEPPSSSHPPKSSPHWAYDSTASPSVASTIATPSSEFQHSRQPAIVTSDTPYQSTSMSGYPEYDLCTDANGYATLDPHQLASEQCYDPPNSIQPEHEHTQPYGTQYGYGLEDPNMDAVFGRSVALDGENPLTGFTGELLLFRLFHIHIRRASGRLYVALRLLARALRWGRCQLWRWRTIIHSPHPHLSSLPSSLRVHQRYQRID